MTLPETPLHQLARAIGITPGWRDVDGVERHTGDDALGAVLGALGYACGTAAQARASLTLAGERHHAAPALLVTEVGEETPLPLSVAVPAALKADVTGAGGMTRAIPVSGGMLGPIDTPGYFDVKLGGQVLQLAVAPARCPAPPAPRGLRRWGAAVQIPALRGRTPRAFGNFADLADAAEVLGRHGADALAINPVHALYPGVGDDFSPYSPSSRQFLNTAMGDPALLGLQPLPAGPAPALIDWPTALPDRLGHLRAVFGALSADRRATIAADNLAEGQALARHALFDALDCHFRPRGLDGWQQWPADYHDPSGTAAQAFAASHAEDVEFHAFAQWLARRGLEQAQQRAQGAGMPVGLIADLAVGVRPGGSDCWAMPDAMLRGLTIGAPPDPLGPLGQNWGITSFSPQGLRESGYAPFIAMLRAALRSAGGLRIDHAFGLARLWVVPAGGTSGDGAYLTYPFLDLVRLACLEAHLAGAMIVAEDLGTAPFGFTPAIESRAMPGMRVLWFQRAEDHGFIGAQDYPADALAMTGTHDTATVAGWWSGRDLDWADRLGRLPEGMDRAVAEDIRAWDRGLLWSTIGTGDPRPAPQDTAPVVDAALAHVARSPAVIAIAPLEDLLGAVEQPNLPGTISGTTGGHPNWQQRLDAPLADLLDNPSVRARMEVMGGH